MNLRCLALLIVISLARCVSPGSPISTAGLAGTPVPAASGMPAASEMPALTSTISPVVPIAASSPTSTASPAPTASPTDAPSPTEVFSVCTPLDGITVDELIDPDLLKVPFQAPRPGMDDGHHGVDFAYWSRGDRKTMTGHPVLSVLQGRVAGLIRDRRPYGNAVIIETGLDTLPVDSVLVPTPQPTNAPLGPLTCPMDENTYTTSGERSIYLLYAHLNQAPALEIGQTVTCGQVIGEVGTTGSSINAHLHLEARVGPGSVVFESLSHDYFGIAATEAERALYCTWRTSGLFQMVDPMQLFQ